MHNSKHTVVPESTTLVGSPESTSSLSSLSCTSSDRSNGSSSAKSASSSSERSVKFDDVVETFLEPSTKELTVEEKQAAYLSEADYRRSTFLLERDVDRMLFQQQQQYSQKGNLSPKQTALKEDKETCFLGLDGVTPQGTWIRENLQRSGKEAVTVEQYCQGCRQHQQQEQPFPHSEGGSTDSAVVAVLDDESVAAAYIPVAMQAQTLAYERAVRNAMEADQFPTTLHKRKHDHPLQYEFILPHIPEL